MTCQAVLPRPARDETKVTTTRSMPVPVSLQAVTWLCILFSAELIMARDCGWLSESGRIGLCGGFCVIDTRRESARRCSKGAYSDEECLRWEAREGESRKGVA